MSARGDQKFSEKDSLAASWFYDKGPQTDPDVLGDVLNELFMFREMVGLEETHVFSPTMVATGRFGYNRAVGLNNVSVRPINPLARISQSRCCPRRICADHYRTRSDATGGIYELHLPRRSHLELLPVL